MLLKMQDKNQSIYLFRWIIIYTIVWYFTWSLHRKLDPRRNGILHTRWCIHPYLETIGRRKKTSPFSRHNLKNAFAPKLTNQKNLPLHVSHEEQQGNHQHYQAGKSPKRHTHSKSDNSIYQDKQKKTILIKWKCVCMQ